MALVDHWTRIATLLALAYLIELEGQILSLISRVLGLAEDFGLGQLVHQFRLCWSLGGRARIFFVFIAPVQN